MYKISFVNPNFQQGPKELYSWYLPYSVATLWAYSHQFEHIKEKFELGMYVWRRDDLEETIEKLKDNHIVGFSVYVWNNNYCCEVAKRLKELNPNILIVFGGPQPPIEKPEFFELFPYVDICVKTEGEISFKRILENYESKDFLNIPGLLVNHNGKLVDTGSATRISELDTIPSPYLNGYFDDLMAEFPEVTWTGILETNRGCPYQCTFCDWGSLTYSKIKKFDIDRVFAELEWMGQHAIDYIAITDANFGIFPERDMSIATKLVEVQQKYANPKNYTISWAKNQRAEVVEIVKKLMFEGGTKMGLNVSVQSMDDNTLDVIKRKNLAMNKIEEVFDACEIEGIPLYTELILGLPGETLDSWKQNYYKLYEAGNHTGVTTYQAQLLENAEMNLTQRNLYCLEGLTVYDYLTNSELDTVSGIREGIEIIVSTLDLPKPKMLQAQMFSWYQNTFHINGLTPYISRFLKKHIGETYENFYDKLYDYVIADPWVAEEYERVKNCYYTWLNHGHLPEHQVIAGIKIHGWNLIHSTLIKIHIERKINYIMNLIAEFVRENYSDRVDADVLDELIKFQTAYIIDPERLNMYPYEDRYKYDFLAYIQDAGPLEQPGTYCFEFPDESDISIQNFCEKIFFHRRKNYGKAWITRL